MRRLSFALAVVLGAGLMVAAPAAPAHAASLTTSQYEAQIVGSVNAARERAGLAPLTVSVKVATVARGWSQTMASSGSFRHNPSYASQMPSGWSAAGENVAYGYTTVGQYSPATIHENLMGSSGHRANILKSSYTHLGVGVAFVERGGKSYVYVTQNFGAYPAAAAPDGPTVSASTPFEQVVLTPDVTGDPYDDLFAVDSSGRLFTYAGRSDGSVRAVRSLGTGWSAYDVHAPGDWDGDGRADLVAVDGSGVLWLYRGAGGGAVGARTKIGHGWSSFRIIPAGDVNGDRAADLLAIDSAERLWLYPGDGRGGFRARLQVGNGWGGFVLHAAGDLTRDGRADIVGIDEAGRLFFYAGRGKGYFRQRVQVGHGWSGYTFTSGGDVNADGLGDLVGRDPQGRLWFYAGRQGGTFAMKTQIGRGW
ncbi:hypothetical protein GXB85_10280 [Cellulomonas sp. APG4]|uniref:FG-GAP-like repeat-containing protein n=1 Tax=Cellulomonas sp. APG4 TaxID=1538656 RepID=UPI00137B8D71|nr:FG-GAP-like repeat-containing protein [Cellulomonas sp. APG4]NCT91336.1 hypothetical protein [Cellulomonas sp. APG4]